MHIRLVNVYLLNVPSVLSRYFNKIKRTSPLGKWHTLLLEILCLFGLMLIVPVISKGHVGMVSRPCVNYFEM